MSRGFRRMRQLASASCLMLYLSHCTPSVSLVLTPTPQGLRLEANLPQTPVGRSRASVLSYLKLDAFILCQ